MAYPALLHKSSIKDLSALADGAAIGSWADSIAGGAFSISNATNKLTYHSSGGYNGFPYASFDGNDYLIGASRSAISNWSGVAIVKTAADTGQYFLRSGDNSAAIVKQYDSGKWSFYDGGFVTIATISADWQIIGWRNVAYHAGTPIWGGSDSGAAGFTGGTMLLAEGAGWSAQDVSDAMAAALAEFAADTTPPSTVTNLLATKVSNGQINLDSDAATDNVGVTGYITEKRENGGTYSALVSTAKSFSYTFTPPGIETTFDFRRKAKDAAGNVSASYSNIASVTIPASITGEGDSIEGAIDFIETELSRSYSEGAKGGPSFSTAILESPLSGQQQRNINRYDAIHQFELSFQGEPEETNFTQLLAFFMVMHGAAIGFRFFPFFDNSWNNEQIALTQTAQAVYKLVRTYEIGGRKYIRRIVKPIPNIILLINGVAAETYSAWTCDYTTGKISFAAPANLPVNGVLRVTGKYCIPVVFNTDNVEASGYASYLDLQGLSVVEILPSALGID